MTLAEIGTVVLSIAFLVLLGIFGVKNVTTDRACLQRGWREGRVDFMLTSYCVNRVDQADALSAFDACRAAQVEKK